MVDKTAAKLAAVMVEMMAGHWAEQRVEAMTETRAARSAALSAVTRQ